MSGWWFVFVLFGEDIRGLLNKPFCWPLGYLTYLVSCTVLERLIHNVCNLLPSQSVNSACLSAFLPFDLCAVSVVVLLFGISFIS